MRAMKSQKDLPVTRIGSLWIFQSRRSRRTCTSKDHGAGITPLDHTFCQGDTHERKAPLVLGGEGSDW